MNLKKEMEKDLEEAKKQEVELTRTHEWGKVRDRIELYRIEAKIKLIEKYLEAFENDMVVEVGKKYRVKENKYISVDHEDVRNYVDEESNYFIVSNIYESDFGYMIVDGDVVGNFIGYGVDLETFKHMFEECVDE